MLEHRGASGRQGGIALVAVLWITALLALLAAGVGSSSRTSLRLAENGAELAAARAIADGGVHQALFELLTFSDDMVWQKGAVEFQRSLGRGNVTVRIRDEDGKLDVNAISVELWQQLLLAIGLNDDAARRLADRIVDYRDPDDEMAPLGAEDPQYAAAGRLEGAADRPFLMISELLNVLGMTGEVYERLRPHITVYADVEGLDPSRASKLALEALPGMTTEMAETVIASPPGTDPLITLADGLDGEADAYLLPSRELVFSILSEGRTEYPSEDTNKQGGRYVREAIVALDGGTRDLPFTLYAWRRSHPIQPAADGSR